MQLIYYKAKKGNFGDDLNPWLWEKILPNFKEFNQYEYFFGVGSILSSDNKSLQGLESNTKLVFGSGFRPSRSYKKFEIDDSWNIKFVRGPLSSEVLNEKYITDAAYAIRQMPSFSTLQGRKKKYKVSLMPYFHSMDLLNWQKVCDELGFHFISPHSEEGVEKTLEEIASSESIITEAMHGAICADLLRVPWHRFVLSTPFTEQRFISDFKWLDWTKSVGIDKTDISFIPLYKGGKVKELINSLTMGGINMDYRVPKLKSRLSKGILGDKEFYLSDDKVVSEIDSKMDEEINKLSKELANI